MAQESVNSRGSKMGSLNADLFSRNSAWWKGLLTSLQSLLD